jgi:flagellar hook-associated protein 2
MNGVMGMLSGDTLDSSKRQLGSDASFQINGLSTTRKSNIFTIDGTTFTLKGASGSNDVTVSVNNDVDKVYDTIKSFIDQYNKTLDLLNTTTAEKRYRDYPPLLDEQKKDMKDSEIELWEEKAKSGLLSNDALLQRAISNFRTTIYARVGGMTGQIDQLAEIGITTESYTDSEGGVVITGGKLVIDEQKLRDALVNSPDEVMDLFTKSSDTPGEKGIANRLYDTVNQVMSDIIDKAGRDDNDTNSALYKQMKDMNTRIDDMQRHLTDVENRYYAQFSAMEQALNQMNQQSMWLMQQFGGGQ